MAETEVKPSGWRWLRTWVWGLLRLLLIGVLFGWFYGWASPKFYPSSSAGFRYGLLHGALMPMALPSLLLGQDVPIYAENNTGRTYKLGYIVGINICGFIFFGLAFAQPKRIFHRRAPSLPKAEPMESSV